MTRKGSRVEVSAKKGLGGTGVGVKIPEKVVILGMKISTAWLAVFGVFVIALLAWLAYAWYSEGKAGYAIESSPHPYPPKSTSEPPNKPRYV